MTDAQNPKVSEIQHKYKHIKLSTHPGQTGKTPLRINWGASSAQERGPIIGSTTDFNKRNVIGTHSGSYTIYRALAMAAGKLDPSHRPDLTDTSPAESIGPFQQWTDPSKIVSIDPYGHMVSDIFKEKISDGFDIRPTIAVTKAHINLPEIQESMRRGRLKADGHVLTESGDVTVTKAAIEPVWYLPGIAERFKIDLATLRRTLFEAAGGMFPELVTRPDLDVFLPPIGGITIYIMGDSRNLSDPSKTLACRVHDECNGSDVFGSDICTCRPYLVHGIEQCIRTAQEGGSGAVIYNRKEGRALGEVTKFLVYNARKRQVGGDRAEKYFERTECIAGVQDMRFQELMPDALHWLGISKIDQFCSMSNMKSEALAESGIEIKEQIEIPDELIPADAQVEMDAKRAAGYFSQERAPKAAELKKTKGRGLTE
jgi:GTP cyclohydrolase II